jgi:ketosteroid isomerase-like protein
VDAETIRAWLEDHFAYASSDPDRAHAMYHDDAVLEFPQSGERFAGIENFREWRSAYPAPTSPEITRIRGAGDVWVAELTIAYGEGAQMYGVTILELRDGKVARETIYVSEGWEAPEWRAQWRDAS